MAAIETTDSRKRRSSKSVHTWSPKSVYHMVTTVTYSIHVPARRQANVHGSRTRNDAHIKLSALFTGLPLVPPIVVPLFE
jgi:hypothetical protein